MSIDEPFWMGTCEVTNAQFRRFAPGHDSGYYARRLPRPDGQGAFHGTSQAARRSGLVVRGDGLLPLAFAAGVGVEFTLPDRGTMGIRLPCRKRRGVQLWGDVTPTFRPGLTWPMPRLPEVRFKR